MDTTNTGNLGDTRAVGLILYLIQTSATYLEGASIVASFPKVTLNIAVEHFLSSPMPSTPAVVQAFWESARDQLKERSTSRLIVLNIPKAVAEWATANSSISALTSGRPTLAPEVGLPRLPSTKEELRNFFADSVKEVALRLQQEENSTHTAGCHKTVREKGSAFIKSLLYPQVPITVHQLTLKAFLNDFDTLVKSNSIPIPTSVCNVCEAARSQLTRYPGRDEHTFTVGKEAVDWFLKKNMPTSGSENNDKLLSTRRPNALVCPKTMATVTTFVVVLWNYKKIWGGIKRYLSNIFILSERNNWIANSLITKNYLTSLNDTSSVNFNDASIGPTAGAVLTRRRSRSHGPRMVRNFEGLSNTQHRHSQQLKERAAVEGASNNNIPTSASDSEWQVVPNIDIADLSHNMAAMGTPQQLGISNTAAVAIPQANADNTGLTCVTYL